MYKMMANNVKLALRKRFGLWPTMEAYNVLTMGLRGRALRRFEDKEVSRLRQVLGSTPEASIACIVPTYKRPHGVVEAVNSILAQDRQDFIVLVVDDGGGLTSELPNDPRVFSVSLFQNTKVAGLVRNIGIRLSNSKYVAFLDDDNTWSPEHLRLAIDALESGSDMVYTAIRRKKRDGTEFDILSKPFDRKAFSDEPSWVDTNAIVLRRSAIKLFSRLPRIRTTFPREDWEFVWRVSRSARVTHVPVATVDYLVNAESYYTNWGDNVDEDQSQKLL